MSKRHLAMPLLYVFLGGLCLSLSPGYQSNSDSSSRYPQNVKSGVTDDANDSQQTRYQATGREEIAYLDERDEDIHQRANRMGDWGYRQNWRYDRKAFYKGETQGEAYNEEHPDSAGGIGMDPDTEYLQMRKFYLEEAKRERDPQRRNENQMNNNNRPNNPYRNTNNSSYRQSYPNDSMPRDNDSNYMRYEREGSRQNFERQYPSNNNSPYP